jgi:hypothetical protein
MTALTGKRRACGPSLQAASRAVASVSKLSSNGRGELCAAAVLFEIILHQIII